MPPFQPSSADFAQVGAIAMALWVAGLFFLRFWRETRDRLFLMFAGAFWLLSLNQCLLVLSGGVAVPHPYHLIVRLVGYLLIVLAIVDKNRSSRREADY
jgi:small-conductance mechanosensitive channel